MSLSTIDPYAASYPPSLWEKPEPEQKVEEDKPTATKRKPREQRE